MDMFLRDCRRLLRERIFGNSHRNEAARKVSVLAPMAYFVSTCDDIFHKCVTFYFHSLQWSTREQAAVDCAASAAWLTAVCTHAHTYIFHTLLTSAPSY